ncbi:sec-independent protein translocase protein [Salmonella bongori]|uniref:Sec-independent protein translocase protein n=2 Tax=Salmonella enterica TaxID=28901 RepID=A0A7D8IWC3_SALER|nr:sec-independent protein translocase protein [Salmonella enterica]VDZ81814.1 sec-independent protein translocase protein [Salmonella bongori]VEA07911.1 sec-independent protein translocase protein [Salmonella enterica subsp. salamae]VUC91551.1 sec-independent protein translocase protein [Salmonella sp. NCTC 11881]
MGGISIWQLLIVAVIVVLLFGTKKTRFHRFRSWRVYQRL